MTDKPKRPFAFDPGRLPGGPLRWGFYAAGALAAGALIAVSVIWLFAAGRFKDGLADWQGHQRAAGMSFEYGAVSVGGYPLRLTARIEEPRFGRAGKDGPFEWRAPAALIEAWPWNLRRILAHLPAPQRLDYTVDGKPESIEASGGAALLRAEIDGRGRVEKAALELREIELVFSGGARRMQVASAVLRAEIAPPQSPAGMTLDLRGERVLLPVDLAGPLGREIAVLAARADIKGEFPALPPRQAIAAWRDAGGTIELPAIAMKWNKLDLNGSGTMAADRDLQPVASFSATARGYAETIDSLAAARMVGAVEAAGAKLVLGLLAKQPADGGAPAINIPLTVQDGKLWIGPVALLRIGKIVWP